VAKINHSRPTLRLLDNYKREMRSQAYEYSRSEVILVSDKNKKMPIVGQEAQELIISMLDAAGLYFDASSKIFKVLLPNASKSLRKKRPSFEKEMENAKLNLVEVCVELVIEALRERKEGNKGIVNWLTWFQDEAQRTNDYGMFDIFEIGIKPAFQRLEAVIGLVDSKL